ncbi:cytochrome 82A3-like [Capsicum chacoense]|uniref:cytochrome P450 82A3-like n=1 Tax=Capsicum annuum TaxID=4072 RepID=UPI001FB07759|nr:cytochrome P450 82A3-like [Capsicum annuum]
MDFSLAITCVTTFIIFFYFIYMLLGILNHKNSNFNRRTPPKVAGSWRVIGHLHLFSGSGLPHKIFGLMADKYGPIFTVKFGAHQVLVVNDWKIAQDCLTINDKALPSRPKAFLGYNYAIFGLGPYWREMKKLVVLELLSNHRVPMFRHIREFEVKTSITTTYERWSKEKMSSSSNFIKIEMKHWFENLIMTIIVRMLFGKEYDLDEGQRAGIAIRKFFKLLGTFVVADFIPSLRWLDIGGYEKEMKENAKETDCILENWLVEHKRKRSCGELKNEDEKDFMDIMLSFFEGARDEDLPGLDADTIIKSTCFVGVP